MFIHLATWVLFLISDCSIAQRQQQVVYGRKLQKVILKCKKMGKTPVWKGPENFKTYSVGSTLSPDLEEGKRLRINIEATKTHLNLVIKQFSTEDQGIYKCTNQEPEVFFDVQLLEDPVNMTIQHETSNHLIYGFVNRSLELKCSVVSGTPSAIVKWKSDNETLIHGIQETLIYSFKPRREHHLKRFTCVAKNNYTLTSLQRTVQVFLYHIPVVTVGWRNISIVEKSNLTLHCEYTSNNNITGIAWTHTGLRNEYKEELLSILSNETTLFLNSVSRNQSGKYQCIVHNLAGQAMDEVFVTVKYVPSIDIIYRNSTSERWLVCRPEDIQVNFTFYTWEHISSFHEHIRYLDGNTSGTLKLHNTLGETNRHYDAGIYVCRVSIENFYNVSEQYFLNTTGKPYFVSSNKDVQTGVIGHRTQLTIYVVSQPMIKSVTVQTKNSVPIQTNYTTEEDVKTYDIVYGKKITVLATQLYMFIQLSESDQYQKLTVIVTNYFGSTSFEVTVKPETQETSTSFPNRTQMLMIIINVVLAILLLCGGIMTGLKVIHCHKMSCCRKELNPANESREERHAYDEIDNLSLSTTESNRRPPSTDNEDIEMPFTNTTPHHTTDVITNGSHQLVTDLCLSEVENIFRTRLSTSSANTSDTSYLSPSAPYTELTQIHRRPHSFHEYEQITNCDQMTERVKLSEKLVHKERHVKRSTI